MKKIISLLTFFSLAATSTSEAQNFINGDFEIHPATSDQINLTNVGFNGLMSNVTAFGTNGNLDIITSPTWSGLAQNGSWYIALTGLGTDRVALELTTPLVTGNTYTIQFYDRATPVYQSFLIQLGASMSATAVGTPIGTTSSFPVNGVWTLRTITFVAPNNAPYITVTGTSGTVGNWAHIDNFSFAGCSGSINFGNDTTICTGTTLLLDATYPNATYVWQDGSTSATFQATQAGTYHATVTAGACTFSDTIALTTSPTPIVNLGNDTVLCPGDVIPLDATTTGNVQYLWNTGSTSPTLQADSAGVYHVSVTEGQCTATDTIMLTYVLLPDVLGNDTIVCAGETVSLNATQTGATYLWQDNSSTATHLAVNPGTYWVTMSLNGCSVTDTVVVSHTPLPIVNLGPDSTFCGSLNHLLDATLPGATYQWQDNTTGAGFQANSPGTYWVDVTQNGCSKRDSITLALNPIPAPFLGNDTIVCPGASVILETQYPGEAHLWHDNQTVTTYNATSDGIYAVAVTIDGCTGRDSITIDYKQVNYPDLGENLIQCDSQQVVLTPGFFDSYQWDNMSTDSVRTVFTAGTYFVTVTSNGCTLSDTLEISKEGCIEEIKMPNVFTPNGDGVNDYFIPVIMEHIQSASLIIFNRWGQKIYETNDLNAGWDGRCGGGDCSSGTYFWMMNYTSESGITGNQKGTVTLIR